jgi:disulfide bond formation protein DsbB
MAIPSLMHTRPQRAIAVCAAVSAALLAGAHLFERVGGLDPCLLCLDQREIHWTALAIAAGSYLVWRFVGDGRVLCAGLGALAFVYLFSMGIAGYHAGVEWDFWAGPAACASSRPLLDIDPGALLQSMNAPGPAGPSCEEAPWRFLGLSMAGYNALISLALAALSAAAAIPILRAGCQPAVAGGMR